MVRTDCRRLKIPRLPPLFNGQDMDGYTSDDNYIFIFALFYYSQDTVVMVTQAKRHLHVVIPRQDALRMYSLPSPISLTDRLALWVM